MSSIRSHHRRFVLTALLTASAAGCDLICALLPLPTTPETRLIVPSPAAVGPATPQTDVVAFTQACLAGHLSDVYWPVFESPPNAPHPVVILLQGANVDKLWFRGVARTVASYGFVVAVPNYLSAVPPGLLTRWSIVPDLLDALSAVANDADSPLFQRIDVSRLALLGHSLGGAAALAAVQNRCEAPLCDGRATRPDALRAVATYGTDLQLPLDPTADDPISIDGIPVMILRGDRDSISGFANAGRTYDRLINGPRALVSLIGANHFAICDVNNPPGSVIDLAQPQLVPSVSTETIGRWTAMFFRAFVLGEDAARDYIAGGSAGDTNATVIIEY